MAEFLPDKNINVGAGLGLDDLSKGKGLLGKKISTDFNRSFNEIQAGFSSFRQDEIAAKIIQDYGKEVDKATNGALGGISGGLVQALNPPAIPSVNDLLMENPSVAAVRDYDKKIKELHEKYKGAFPLKTSEQLREDFIAERERQLEGDLNYEKNPITAFAGGAAAIVTDPLSIFSLGLTRGVAAFKAGASFVEKAARAGLHGLFGEAIVQAHTEQSTEDRILGLALAPIAAPAIMALGKTFKGAAKAGYPSVKKAIDESLKYTAKKSGNLSENFAKQLDNVAEALPESSLKLKVKEQADLLNLQKGTLKESLDNLDKTISKFNQLESIGKVTQRAEITSPKLRNPTKDTSEILTEMSEQGIQVNKANYEEAVLNKIKNENIPLTTSGKYSTYFESEQIQVRDAKGKLRTKNVSKPLEFETREAAQMKINKLNEESPFKHSLYIREKENGKFTLLKDTAVEALPHSRTYATRAIAEADIENMVKLSGIPIEEIKVLKGTFLNKKTGQSGETYRLATGFDEHDLASIKNNVDFSADRAPARLKTTVEDEVDPPQLYYDNDPKFTTMKEPSALEYEQVIGQIMDDPNIEFKAPNYANKKEFQEFIKKAQATIKDFESCIG